MAISTLHATNTSVFDRSPSVTFTGYTPALGDYVLFGVASSVQTVAVTDTATWTNILGSNTVLASDSHWAALIYRPVTSGEVTAGTTTYTATNFANSNLTGGVIGVVIRGADGTNPIDSSNTSFNSANSTSHTLPGLTGTNLSTGSTVLSFVTGDGSAQHTSVTGWTILVQQAAGNQTRTMFKLDTTTTAGTNVSAATTTVGAAEETAGITIALIDPTAGGADHSADFFLVL